jgi:hypothetical protein
MARARGQEGQATVELVALLPVIVLVAAVLWQGAVAGQAVWVAGSAARAAARAQALGADVAAAARGAVPGRLRGDVSVRTTGDGGVSVVLGVPSVLGRRRVGTVTASARFAAQVP